MKSGKEKFSIDIFSPRELEVLGCIINGHSYKAAGLILKMSDRTVNTHIRNICTKIGVATKEQIINFLSKNGALTEIRDKLCLAEDHTVAEQNSEIIESISKDLESGSKHKTNLFKKSAKIVLAIVVLLACHCAYRIWFRKMEPAKIITDGVVVNDSSYIDRKNITNKMDDFLLSKNSIVNVVTLIGHGGAGKTTIARRYLQEKGYDFAYEINAETVDSTRSSMKSLAYALAKTDVERNDLKYILSIPEEAAKEKQLFLFIQSKLSEISNWCLLFDNVEDFYVLKKFCPYGNGMRGSIIITTRN